MPSMMAAATLEVGEGARARRPSAQVAAMMVVWRLRAEHDRRGEEALAGSQLEQMLAGDGRLARHAQHHSRAHMKAMKVAISNGLNFDQAHRWALLRVGR